MIDFPIIDSHVHLLDTARFNYPWLSETPSLQRDWAPADLTTSAKPHTIESFVFVEADVAMPQYLGEAEWIQAVAGQDPRLKGCVACLPLEQGPALEPEMERLARLPVVRGVRRLIQNQPDPDFVLRPGFIAATRLLPNYRFSFDICIVHHQLPTTIEFVRRCPEVSFILDHIAKPGIKAGLADPWRQHMKILAAQPNVMCKLSGLTTEADHGNWSREQLRPYIDHAIECFGFDRIMFGGDWPVSELAGPYAGWVDTLDWATSGCSRSQKRKLFRDNAIRAYRLS